ncbi:MAG TPA: response regulator [Nannocystaceae bacterium]|nr:response regulator [Nannocystaceae bacterium]
MLIVDDQPYVLRAIQRVLADGHDVVTANDGRAALAAIAASERPFDVMLCDVELEGLDVVALWGELATHHPYLLSRLVFMSAGVLTRAHEDFLVESGRPLLDKPFHIAELRAMVSRTLAAAVAPRLLLARGLAAVDPTATVVAVKRRALSFESQ